MSRHPASIQHLSSFRSPTPRTKAMNLSLLFTSDLKRTAAKERVFNAPRYKDMKSENEVEISNNTRNFLRGVP